VAEVNPNLVVRDENGEIYTVRYDAVNAMLLNEFLKEHKAFLEEQRKVQEQDATIAQVKSNAAKQEEIIADLKSGMQALTATVKEQASQIQKVSARLEGSKPAPQVAENNQ
jgi:methyl-accepting chemotaxis protein